MDGCQCKTEEQRSACMVRACPHAGCHEAAEISPSAWGRLIDRLPTRPPVPLSPPPSAYAMRAALDRGAFVLRKHGMGGYDNEQASVLELMAMHLERVPPATPLSPAAGFPFPVPE